MTSYSHSHNPNNHLSRRASTSAPYSIPNKSHQSGVFTNNHSSTPFSPPSNVHIPQHQQNHPINYSHTTTTTVPSPSITNGHNNNNSNTNNSSQSLSSSVPLLSREFVVRRISEGETGRLKEELKCEACGKGYKHISSLAKHLWEHTPEWNVTKKLLISKHQQVQLLEAASILVSMNEINSPNSKSNNHTISTINEEEIKFNIKYQDRGNGFEDDEYDDNAVDSPSPGDSSDSVIHSTHTTNEQSSILSPPSHDDDHLNIKLRTNSISQYPPSSINHNNSIVDGALSPLKYDDSNNGGFLDTPLRNKILSHRNIDENVLIDDAYNNKLNNDNDAKNNNNITNDNEDDDGVFGKME